MSNDEEAKSVQHQMADLRRDLAFAVDEASASARQWKDWRYYVHRFPWVSVVAVTAAGFLLVPKRTSRLTPNQDQLAELARHSKLVIEDGSKRRSGDSIGGKLMAMVLAAGSRAAVEYVSGIMRNASQGAPDRSRRLDPVGRPPK